MINIKNQILNLLLLQGKKRTSEKIIFIFIKLIQKQFNKNHKLLIKSAILNCSPITQIKKIRRKKRKTKEFPVILKKKSRLNLGIKTIILNSKKKVPKFFFFKLLIEIIESSKSQSTSVSKTESLHEDSFIKKKYANYRWF